MQLLAREFAERADRAPGDLAVIDALGEHTVGEVMAAARDLAAALEERSGRIARRCWSRPTTPGGPSRRRSPWGCAAAWWRCSAATPSRPSSSSRWRTSSRTPWWPPTTSSSTGRSRARRSPTSGPRSTAGRSSPPGGTARDVDRWARRRRGRDDLRLDRPRQVRRAVRGRRCGTPAGRPSTRSVCEPGDAVGAFVPLSSVAAFCFGMYLPAMLGGPMVCIETWRPDDALDAMAAHDVRWTMLVPTMALQLSIRPSAPGRLVVPEGDDRGRWPHGRRRARSRRAGPRARS